MSKQQHWNAIPDTCLVLAYPTRSIAVRIPHNIVFTLMLFALKYTPMSICLALAHVKSFLYLFGTSSYHPTTSMTSSRSSCTPWNTRKVRGYFRNGRSRWWRHMGGDLVAWYVSRQKCHRNDLTTLLMSKKFHIFSRTDYTLTNILLAIVLDVVCVDFILIIL